MDLADSISCEEDSSVVNSYVDRRVKIKTQYLTQYFNLDYYVDNKSLSYVGLMPDTTYIILYNPKISIYVV